MADAEVIVSAGPVVDIITSDGAVVEVMAPGGVVVEVTPLGALGGTTIIEPPDILSFIASLDGALL